MKSPPRRPVLVSSAALVLANLVPLAGVLAGGWRVFDVLLLFWAENVVIGILNLARMAMVALRGERGGLAMAGFFAVHYGIFTVVHGVFVVTLFGPPGASPIAGFALLLAPGLALPLAALAASHGLSFVVNFVVGGEMDRTTLGALMAAPYGRVVVLHVTIIFGGFAVEASGAPIVALALLVGLKILVDLAAHVAEHRGPRAAAARP
ncbi:DUF6498-containing protein [Salinarimonas rosea]|uniref:DUF6498-containing protein n=1 Tax=Salinarimonas rosea TaxID=552063 RepID=UPI000403CAF2|nr:DUF6498-containing protein [Salinarimonas rosea]